MSSKILIVLNEGGIMDDMAMGLPPYEDYALIDCQNGAAGDIFTFTEDWRPLLQQFFHGDIPAFVKIEPSATLTPEQAEKAMQARIDALKDRVQANIAELRAISQDPFSIPIAGTPVDIEIHPENHDQRVTVGHETMGYTVVNYTQEGLIMDVYSGDPGSLDPTFTSNWYRDDLECDDDGAEAPASTGRQTS
jgi:hypothetical protein